MNSFIQLLFIAVIVGSVHGYKKPNRSVEGLSTESGTMSSTAFLGSITGVSSYLLLKHDGNDIDKKIVNPSTFSSTTTPDEDEEILISRTMMLARGGFL